MRTKFKLSAIMLSILVYSGVTQAQTQTKSADISAPEKIKEGNSFEREMTPLLREISKRKSQLELRKLERELAKIDEDEMKAQLEIEEKNKKITQTSNPVDNSITFAGMPNVNGSIGGLMLPGQAPMGLPAPTNIQNSQTPNLNPSPIKEEQKVVESTSKPEDKKTKKKKEKSEKVKNKEDLKEESKEEVIEEDLPPLLEIKVLMIYGFDGNLSAKIAAGGQGGYVVQKGDVMPDGRVVTEINPNFIEVKDVKNKLAKGFARIFVTSGEVLANEKSDEKNKGGDQDATNSGGTLKLKSKNNFLPTNVNPNSSIKDSDGFKMLSQQSQQSLIETEEMMKTFNVGINKNKNNK